MEPINDHTPQQPRLRKTYPRMENAATHIQNFRGAILRRLFTFFFEFLPRVIRRCATWIQNIFTPLLGAGRRVLLQIFGTTLVFLVLVVLWGFVCWWFELFVWPEWRSKWFLIPSIIWGAAIIIAVLVEVVTIIKTRWGGVQEWGLRTFLIFLVPAALWASVVWWFRWFVWRSNEFLISVIALVVLIIIVSRIMAWWGKEREE